MPGGPILGACLISEPAVTTRCRPRGRQLRTFLKARRRETTPPTPRRSRMRIGSAARWYANWRSIGRAIERPCRRRNPKVQLVLFPLFSFLSCLHASTCLGSFHVTMRRNKHLIFSRLQKLLWWFYSLRSGCPSTLRRL